MPPEGFVTALDRGTGFWSGGRLATGGAPWRVIRSADAALPMLGRLRRTGTLTVTDPASRRLVRLLLDQGFVHPVPAARPGPHPVTVVVPAYGRADRLELCLAALAGLPVIVVDDGSPDPGPVAAAAGRHGARLLRQPVNRGPAAARNAGLAAADTPFVAFVDSDCRPEPGWLDRLMPHFDDPKAGAVAPRVRPEPGDRRLLARHEATRSALDMGGRPALVRPGARLSFVPTATLLVRTATGLRFDERLRLGEDVDFVWRLADAGWLVRYEPRAGVRHDARVRPVQWARRRFEYGTSAAALAARHPDRLYPLRPSAWNLATLGCLALRRRAPAAACAAVATGLLYRTLSRSLATTGPRTHLPLAGSIVARGTLADGVAVGHALRREWWPLGLAVLAASPRSRIARLGAAAMLAPLALEWARDRPAVDPLRYTALRLVEDAAYGTGVLASALRARTAAPLRPRIRLPGRAARARARPRPGRAPGAAPPR